MADNTINWGQATVNNDIDWGGAKVNSTNGFGAVYENSPSKDTDILGVPPFPNNYSMNFDGVDEFIQGGNIGISGNATFSMSYWAYWDGSSFSIDYPSVVGNSTFSVSNGLSTTWKDGRPALDFWTVRYRADDALLTQQWYHLVFTKTQGDVSTTSKIYVNGFEVNGSLEGTDTNPNITNSNLIIGRLNNVSTRYWNGSIDEVAIWNTALSSTQVSEIYNATRTNSTSELSTIEPSNLKLWFRMGDGDTFPTVTDNAGSNDGTMTNMDSSDIVNDTPS